MGSIEGILDGFRTSLAANRLAHGYIVDGNPRGAGHALVIRVLQLLFCAADDKPCGSCAECIRVAKGHHPDVTLLEPKSKGREILADEIRALSHRISTTSYAGWKAGVILWADRMRDPAANAFLKTLEEPPPRSLLLLVTDAPQFLLPTIASRCHRIALPSESFGPTEKWLDPLKGVLCDGPPRDVIEAIGRAAALNAIMEDVKQDITEEEDARANADEDDDVLDARISARVREVQRDVITAILFWHRDVLVCAVDPDQRPRYFVDEEDEVRKQAEAHTQRGALACVEAVEVCADQLHRNITRPVVFEQMMVAHGRASMQAR